MGVLATNRFTHSSVWAVCLPVYANGDRGEHVLDEPQIHVLRVAGYLPLHLSVSALSRQRPTCRQCSGSRLERRKEPFCGGYPRQRIQTCLATVPGQEYIRPPSRSFGSRWRDAAHSNLDGVHHALCHVSHLVALAQGRLEGLPCPATTTCLFFQVLGSRRRQRGAHSGL